MDHLRSGGEAEVRCFWKLGHLKVALCPGEFRNTCAYSGKVHAQKNPEKSLSIYIGLFLRLKGSLGKW